MSAWTPGPWVYYVDAPSIDPTWHIVTTANKMRVIASVHIEPGNVVDEANARLIAAAPCLAEALEETLAIARRNESGAYIWKAEAALRRAKGEA